LNYGITLGFTGLKRDDVEALVKEKIYPLLPAGTLVTIDTEEEVSDIAALDNFIGEHITIETDENHHDITGYLAEVFHHKAEHCATLVFEDGGSYLANEFEVAIINKGGEYDRSEDEGEPVEKEENLATVTSIGQLNNRPEFERLMKLLNVKFDK